MLSKIRLTTPHDFQPTTVNKETYLDVMEIAFKAYSIDAIQTRKKLDGGYLELQSYSRLTSVLACLISGGRMTDSDSRLLWEHMMTECCQEIHTITAQVNSNYYHVYADFSMKEIMLAYRLMKPLISEAKRNEWLTELRKVEPNRNYSSMIRSKLDEEHLHNINIYNMVGEYMRESEGLTDATAYFAKHWPVHLLRFDDNGMYRDPGCPVLYDLTTRCQIELLLEHGYRGEFYEQIDNQLRKGGLMTLLMQSAAGEFPYGGRSNQFLFNEALIASNCEFEANRYQAEGNLELAGAFKRSGHLAILAIQRWLEENPPRHIKNLYPIESGYGTEEYAYYDRYMITMAAFLVIGYLCADDSIDEFPCPAETGGYVMETSDSFHKVFANAGGYSLEIDTKADKSYDATGLGRLHCVNIPTELAISTPLSGGKGFRLPDHVGRLWSGISPGWVDAEGSVQFLSELSEGLDCRLSIIEEQSDQVQFKLNYSGLCLRGCDSIEEAYELNSQGLRYRVQLINPTNNKLWLRIPILYSNGKNSTLIKREPGRVTVELEGFIYTIQHEDTVELLKKSNYGNRNGEYGLILITTNAPTVSITLSLQHM